MIVFSGSNDFINEIQTRFNVEHRFIINRSSFFVDKTFIDKKLTDFAMNGVY